MSLYDPGRVRNPLPSGGSGWVGDLIDVPWFQDVTLIEAYSAVLGAGTQTNHNTSPPIKASTTCSSDNLSSFMPPPYPPYSLFCPLSWVLRST